MVYKKISIVIPIYNEQRNIKKSIKKIRDFLKKNFKKFEIIIVESGSTDGSNKICQEVVKKNKNIKLIKEKTRNGFGSALKKGFQNSSGEIISIFTVDFPFNLKNFVIASKLINNYECILSYRINDKRSLFRKLQSLIFNITAKYLFNLKVKNINSALKVYKSELIKKLKIKNNGWLIDTEIIYLLEKKKINFKEIPVEIKSRKIGSSSINLFTPLVILSELFKFYIKNIILK